MRRFIRLGCAVTFLAIGLASALAAQAMSGGVAFDITAGAGPTTLKQFAAQAHLQLLFDYRAVQKLKTPAIKGQLAPTDALKEMLEGSGFTFHEINDHTIAITRSGAATSSTGMQQDTPPGTEVAQEGTYPSSSPGFLLAQVAQGQPQTQTSQESSAPGTLQEVIVTAQKREERLQDVPISISVLTGKQLESPNITSVADALNTIPGVATSQAYLNGGTIVVIRGVASAQAQFVGASPVAYYLDSVPFGFVKTALAPDENVYDLQRVEVLRGPQGTLYGANALNGVVRILTNDADLSSFDFKVRGSDSYTDGGGNNYRGDLAVNVPLVDGKLAARAVVGYENDSGWVDSPVKDGINDAELRNYRLKLNAQPTDDLSIGLSYWGSRDDFGGPSTGSDQYFNTATNPQPLTSDFDAYGLKIAESLSGYVLTSSTGYLSYTLDADPFDLSQLAGFPFGLTTDLKSRVLSEELYLNSPSDGVWRWSVGGMYRRATEDRFQNLTLLTPQPIFLNTLDITSKSYAVFGELSRFFLDGRLELTAGVRQFHDDDNQVGETAVTGPLNSDSGTWSKTTPRVVLTWHQNQDLMIYGSYSQGFRSGFPQDLGVTLPGSGGTPFPAVKPDTLNNYETGAKGNLWGDRLNFDVSIYFIDWKNVQESLGVPVTGVVNGQTLTSFVTAIVNGTSASGPGIDLGLSTKPLRGLTLAMTGSWNNLTNDEAVYSNGVELFKKGGRLNFSPETTAGASVAYDFPMGASGLTGGLSASVNYTSAQIFSENPGGAVTLVSSGDPITVGKIAMSIKSGEHWSAIAFVNNVNNERGAVTRAYNTPDLEARIAPLTAGLQLEYHYK